MDSTLLTSARARRGIRLAIWPLLILPGCDDNVVPAATAASATSSGAPGASGAGTGASSSASGASTGGGPCDVDGDGHDGAACGGDDCDDGDGAIHPGAVDLNAATGPWTSGAIGPGVPGDLRPSPTMVIDRSGTPHVAYALEGLVHATNASGAWVAAPVAGAALDGAAVGVDASGQPLIAFVNQDGLSVARRRGSAWQLTLIDADADAEVDMALAPSGAVHLAYGAAGTLRHASDAGSGWTSDEVTALAEGSPSIEVTHEGVVHLAYRAEGALLHATSDGGAWATTLVAQGAPWAVSLAVDAGSAQLSWTDSASGGLNHGRMEHGASAWTIGLVSADAPFRTSLALGPSGPTIAFTDTQVRLAHEDARGWMVEPLGFGWGQGVTVAVDGAGTTHVAYGDFLFSRGTFVGYATNRVLAIDGIDQDCDGVDGVDADGDGLASRATGGVDCDDTAPGDGC